ncbi:MAG: AI-2E family transporter [Clostridiales Family XIII bacterium]|jgi:predicted PurR-regulated permease PerM|nr:AI-2E family transporter [Clostridiales Family XIII bacterium]
MNLDRVSIKKIILIIITAAFCLWLVLNYRAAIGLIGYVIGLFMPLIIGICMAFILNVLMKFIENRLLAKMDSGIITGGRRAAIRKRAKRIIALLLALIIVLGIITFVLAMIIPTLKDTIASIVSLAPKFMDTVEEKSSEILDWFGLSGDLSELFRDNLTKIVDGAVAFVSGAGSTLASGVAHVAAGVFSTLTNIIIGFVFALYILLTKETLSRQLKRLTRAYLSDRKAAFLLRLANRSCRVFEKFVSGQCIEAVIIGTLTALGSLAINPRYAVMLGVLVGFTALIPVIGAIIGVAVGALLLVMVSPIQALAFIIFIIVLQQLENHIIYPRVVGKSIGLPGIWVLLAVLIGGSLYGIAGIIIGVPLTSVIYSMLRDDTRRRLKAKARLAEPAEPVTEPH